MLYNFYNTRINEAHYVCIDFCEYTQLIWELLHEKFIWELGQVHICQCRLPLAWVHELLSKKYAEILFSFCACLHLITIFSFFLKFFIYFTYHHSFPLLFSSSSLPLPAFYPSHPLLEKDRASYGSQQSMEYWGLKFLTLDWLCTYVSWSPNNSDRFHFTSMLMKQKGRQLRDLSANFTMTYSRSLPSHCHKPAVPWEVSLADNLLQLGVFYQTTKTHSGNLSKFKIRWW